MAGGSAALIVVLTGRAPLPHRQDWQLGTLDAMRRRIDAIHALEIRRVICRSVAPTTELPLANVRAPVGRARP